MTDVDSKLKALFAVPPTSPDEAFIARVDGVVIVEQKMRAARDSMWRRFAVELTGTVAVVGAFYLLWKMAPSDIELGLLQAPGIAAGMVILLWLGVQFRQPAAGR